MNLKIKAIKPGSVIPYTDGSIAVYEWRCPQCGDKVAATDREGATVAKIIADPICCCCRAASECKGGE